MILWFTIAFNFFPSKNFYFFVLLWGIFYHRKNFSFAVRIFLPAWESFFCHENFPFAVRIILSAWESFLRSENFSFAMIIFILLWESFCQRENLSFVWRESFSFSVRIFLFQWDFSFSVITFLLLWESFFQCESFSFAGRFLLLLRELFFWKSFLPKAKIFGKPYKKSLVCYVAYVQCCEQDPFIFQNIRIV